MEDQDHSHVLMDNGNKSDDRSIYIGLQGQMKINSEANVLQKFVQYRQNTEANSQMMHEMLAMLTSKQDELALRLNSYKKKIMDSIDETIGDLEKKTYRIENLCYRLEKRVTPLEAVDIVSSLESTAKCSAEEVERKLARAFEHFENHFVDMLKKDLEKMEEEGKLDHDEGDHVLPFATFSHLGSSESRLKNLIRKTNSKVDLAMERISAMKQLLEQQPSPGGGPQREMSIRSFSSHFQDLEDDSLTEELRSSRSVAVRSEASDKGSLEQSLATEVLEIPDVVTSGPSSPAPKINSTEGGPETAPQSPKKVTANKGNTLALQRFQRAAGQVQKKNKKMADIAQRLNAFEKALASRFSKIEKQIQLLDESSSSKQKDGKPTRQSRKSTRQQSKHSTDSVDSKATSLERPPWRGGQGAEDFSTTPTEGELFFSGEDGGFFFSDSEEDYDDEDLVFPEIISSSEGIVGVSQKEMTGMKSKVDQTEAKLGQLIALMKTTMEDYGIEIPWEELEGELGLKGDQVPSPPVQTAETAGEEKWATPREGPLTSEGVLEEDKLQQGQALPPPTSWEDLGEINVAGNMAGAKEELPPGADNEAPKYKIHMHAMRSNNQEEEEHESGDVFDERGLDTDGSISDLPSRTSRSISKSMSQTQRSMDSSRIHSVADRITAKIQQRKIDQNFLKKKYHQRQLGMKGLTDLQDRVEEIEAAVMAIQGDHEMFEMISDAFTNLDDKVDGVATSKVREAVARHKEDEEILKRNALEVSITKLKKKLEIFADGMESLIEDPLEICPTEAKQILEEFPKLQVFLQMMGTKSRYTMDILGEPNETSKMIKEGKLMGLQIVRAVVEFGALTHVARHSRIYLQDSNMVQPTQQQQREGQDRRKIKSQFEGVDLDCLEQLPMIQRGPGAPPEDSDIHSYLGELMGFVETFLSHCTNLGRILVEQEVAYEDIETHIRKNYEEDHAAEQEDLLNNFENIKGRIRGVSNKMSTFEDSVNQMINELRDGFGKQDVLKEMESSVEEVRTRFSMLKAEVDSKKGGMAMEASLDKMAERLHIALSKAPAQLEQVSKILERKADRKYVDYLEAQVAQLSGKAGPVQPFLSANKCLSCNQEIGGTKQRASFPGMPSGQMWPGADEKHMHALNTSIPLSSMKPYQDTQQRTTVGKIYPHLHNMPPYVPPPEDGDDASTLGKMRSVSLFEERERKPQDAIGEKVVISKYPRLVPVINPPDGHQPENKGKKYVNAAKGKKLSKDKI